MKTMILSTVIAFLITSPVHAVPLTWVFSGETLPNSAFIDQNDVVRDISGRSFRFLIFLDTGLPGTEAEAEVLFGSQQRAAVQIAGLGVLPVVPIEFVEYLRTGTGGVSFVDFKLDAPFPKQGLQFVPPIQTNPLELGPIAGIAPKSDGAPGLFSDDILEIPGPNLFVVGQVTLFTARVPEDGSTALFLTSALVALGLLRWRYKGSAS
jgi:hypothetical protein